MSALTITNLAISGETDRPLESHQTTPARRRMSGRSGFPDYTRRRSLAGGFSLGEKIIPLSSSIRSSFWPVHF